MIVVALAFASSMLVLSGIGMRVEGGGTGVVYDSPEEMWAGMHFDLIGREVVRHGDYPFGGSGWFQETDGAVRVELEATSAIAAREWRDLRLEAWHALPSSMGVDPNYDAPFVSVPVEAVDGTVEATLALNRTPGVANWWVALTGLGSDGERYVLSAPAGGNTTFRGSVWDWFTLSHNAAGN